MGIFSFLKKEKGASEATIQKDFEATKKMFKEPIIERSDSEQSKDGQCKLIAKHLESGKKLTAMQALTMYDCSRLAARIHDLRGPKYNYNIKTTMVVNNGKKTAVYTLKK